MPVEEKHHWVNSHMFVVLLLNCFQIISELNYDHNPSPIRQCWLSHWRNMSNIKFPAYEHTTLKTSFARCYWWIILWLIPLFFKSSTMTFVNDFPNGVKLHAPINQNFWKNEDQIFTASGINSFWEIRDVCCRLNFFCISFTLKLLWFL